MKPSLLLTGATGAVGFPVLAALLASGQFGRIYLPLRGDPAHRRAAVVRELNDVGVAGGKLELLPADLADPGCSFAAWPEPDVVIHAAASTHFRAPRETLHAINVEGTGRLLQWAAGLPRTPRFIHLSTLCVAGGLTGPVAEQPIETAPDFINEYERSKWLAEQLVFASPLRPEVVRLGIVGGSERDGRCTRPGALHAALQWMRRGLLPLVPGEPTVGVDLVSTDLVARFLARLLEQPTAPGRICHLTAGPDRLTLGELLEVGAAACRATDPAWRNGQILPPVIADGTSFAAFRRSVERSRDLLFNQVLASADAFLPVLLHPKTFATAEAQRVWGGPLPWPPPRLLAERVVRAAIEARPPRTEEAA